MIRSTKASIKFANIAKRNEINEFVDEYRKVCQFFANQLWGYVKPPVLPPKKVTDRIDTWLSKRAVQCASKQASGIVRGTRKKQKKRIAMHKKLIEMGKIREANRLEKKIEKAKMSKPKCERINPELDSRFVKFDEENKTSFDMWITISSIGKQKKISIPIRKTKHYNELDSKGERKGGVRLCSSSVSFCFEIPDVKEKTTGETLGLDMGIINAYTLSNGVSSKKDVHGHDLNSIMEKLSRKRKGSKAFKKAQRHRDNYVNWSVNQLSLKSVKELRIEDLKNVRKGRKNKRKLQHWTYTAIKDKLEARCEENGVRFSKCQYAYSSQRCSQCGWTQKANRNGKCFVCKKCGYNADADFNAAVNISLNLPKVSWKELRKRKNLKGFYYAERKPIVSVSQKRKNVTKV